MFFNIYKKKYNIYNINFKKIIKIFYNHDIIKYLKIFFINFIIFNKFLYEICNLIFYTSNLKKQFLIINNIFYKKKNKLLYFLIKYIIIKSKCFFIHNNKNKKIPDILIILNKKYIFLKILIFNLNLKKIKNNFNNLLNISDILIPIFFFKNNNKYLILYILTKFKFAILKGLNNK